MNTYTYEVLLKVTVNAPEESDAEDLLSDYFGPGPECDDIDVSSVTFTKL